MSALRPGFYTRPSNVEGCPTPRVCRDYQSHRDFDTFLSVISSACSPHVKELLVFVGLAVHPSSPGLVRRGFNVNHLCTLRVETPFVYTSCLQAVDQTYAGDAAQGVVFFFSFYSEDSSGGTSFSGNCLYARVGAAAYTNTDSCWQLHCEEFESTNFHRFPHRTLEMIAECDVSSSKALGAGEEVAPQRVYVQVQRPPSGFAPPIVLGTKDRFEDIMDKAGRRWCKQGSTPRPFRPGVDSNCFIAQIHTAWKGTESCDRCRDGLPNVTREKICLWVVWDNGKAQVFNALPFSASPNLSFLYVCFGSNSGVKVFSVAKFFGQISAFRTEQGSVVGVFPSLHAWRLPWS